MNFKNNMKCCLVAFNVSKGEGRGSPMCMKAKSHGPCWQLIPNNEPICSLDTGGCVAHSTTDSTHTQTQVNNAAYSEERGLIQRDINKTAFAKGSTALNEPNNLTSSRCMYSICGGGNVHIKVTCSLNRAVTRLVKRSHLFCVLVLMFFPPFLIRTLILLLLPLLLSWSLIH